MCVISNPHLSFADGFGTLTKQVAGFHRAVPSTTLDKANVLYSVLLYHYSNISPNVNTIFAFLLSKIHKSFMDIFSKACYNKENKIALWS